MPLTSRFGGHLRFYFTKITFKDFNIKDKYITGSGIVFEVIEFFKVNISETKRAKYNKFVRVVRIDTSEIFEYNINARVLPVKIIRNGK